MKQTETETQALIKQVSILIGSGDQTYGVVSLVEAGTLAINGNATRITRLLASIRRLSRYRDMSNAQFFAALPEALCTGQIWAAPADDEPVEPALLDSMDSTR